MLYIISYLPKVATWRSKGFRIAPLIAEKSTTSLFTGTLGHTVAHLLNPKEHPHREDHQEQGKVQLDDYDEV